MPTLVTYFSAEGTTAKVGKEFAQSIGADVFGIVPEQPYTAAWRQPRMAAWLTLINELKPNS